MNYHMLKEATERNDHTGALLLGAKMLGYHYLAKRLDILNQLVKLEGCVPTNLREYRDQLYNELMEKAKSSLDKEAFKKFYSCF